MAETIDSLQIEIESEAKHADDSLSKLADNLIALADTMSNLKLDKIASNFDGLAGGISKVSSATNSINTGNLEKLISLADKVGGNFDKAAKGITNMSKAASSVKITKPQQELNKFEAEAKRIENDTVKGLNISGFNEMDVRSQFADVTAALKNAIETGSDEGFADAIKKASDLASTLAEVGKIKYAVEMDPADKELLEYIKATNKDSTKIVIEGAKSEFGDDWKNIKGRLGRNFVASGEGLSDTLGIDTFIQELQEKFKNLQLSDQPIEAVQQLADKLTEIRSNQSFTEVKASMDDATTAVNGLLVAADNSAKKFKELSETAKSASKDIVSIGQGGGNNNVSLFGNVSKVKNDVETVKGLIDGAISSLDEEIETGLDLTPALDDFIKKTEEATVSLKSFEEAATSLEDFEKLAGEFDGELDFTMPELEEIPQKADDAKDSLEKMAAMSGAMVALGSAIGQVSSALGKMASFGQNALDKLYHPEELVKGIIGLPTKMLPPLQVAEELIKEKVGEISASFVKLKDTATKAVQKMQNSINKVIQRFSFTVLRKAINAVIDDLTKASASLQKFSGVTGQMYNASIRSMASNTSWLGSSLVAAFAPIANTIAPWIDMLISKLVAAINIVNQFFAALGGQGIYTIAKKTAGAMDSASGSAKKMKDYLLDIDELNVLNDQDNGGSGAGAGGGYEWEEGEVDSKIADFADKVKDIMSKLFDPLQKAWDRTSDYVISGFKYMTTQLARMGKAIGNDFLTMWQEEETIQIFENLMMSLGDLERVVGNLAKNFTDAWEKSKVGLQILENMRDVVLILSEHFRNVTKYMVEWSNGIDFSPLLDGIEKVTNALKELADFIGGVFEDVMENVVLKFIEWQIEEGWPHLAHTVSEVIEAFDFEKIREDLEPVEQAFERLLENLDTGMVNAIGNVGKAFAEWTNSEEFTKFMENIANIMDRISAEDVEKLFTALGTAVLNIAQSLAQFVNSNEFQAFLAVLDAWWNSVDAESLADGIGKIANAILLFKFGEFTLDGIAGFITFVAKLKILNSLSNIAKVAKDLDKVGASAKIASAEATGLLGALQSLAAIVVPITIILAVTAIFAQIGYEVGKKLTQQLAEEQGWEPISDDEFKAKMQLSIETTIKNFPGDLKNTLENPEDWNLAQFAGFGTPFQDLGNALSFLGKNADSLKTLRDNIDETQGPVSDFIVKIGDLADALEEFTPSSIWDKLNEGHDDFIENTSGLDEWWQTNVLDVFSEENFNQLGTDIKTGFETAWQQVRDWWQSTGLYTWWEEDVKPWFSSDKWAELGQGILDGINIKWEEFKEWWGDTALVEWWDEYVAPWFSIDKWAETAQGIKDGIKQKWDETVAQWGKDIKDWWNNHVVKYFKKEEWDKLMKNVSDSFSSGFKGAANNAISALNNVIASVETMVNRVVDAINSLIGGAANLASQIPGAPQISLSLSHVSLPRIPMLAEGGFVPTGQLFVAREPGNPELIGSIGNQTAVMNNSQIVDSVANGVRAAVAEILAPYLAEIAQNTGEVADKEFTVSIGDEEIAEANIRGQRSMGYMLRTS